jgi:hypothetical protein
MKYRVGIQNEAEMRAELSRLAAFFSKYWNTKIVKASVTFREFSGEGSPIQETAFRELDLQI